MAYDDLPYEGPTIQIAITLLVFKILGITLSWIVFGMIIYANSGRNLFVPSLFLISVTGLEGAAMAGFHWRFIATEYPRGFCITQAVLINFFETTVVGLAVALALSTLMAVKQSDVANIRSPFSFHPKISPIALVFPICSFGSWVGVVFGKYGSDIIGPSYIICDATNPPFIKLLTYGAANLLALVPATVASLLAAWQLTKLGPSGALNTSSFDAGTVSQVRKRPSWKAQTNKSEAPNMTSTIEVTTDKMTSSGSLRRVGGDTGTYYPPSTSPTMTSFHSNNSSPQIPAGSTVPSITQYILAVEGKDELDFGGVVVKAKKASEGLPPSGVGRNGNVGGNSGGGGTESSHSDDFGTRSVRTNAFVGTGEGFSSNPTSASAGGSGSGSGSQGMSGGDLEDFAAAVRFAEPEKPRQKIRVHISFLPAILRLVVFGVSVICVQGIAMISPMMAIVKGQQTQGFQSQDVAALLIGYIPLVTWGFTPAVMSTCQEIYMWVRSWKPFRGRRRRREHLTEVPIHLASTSGESG